ncbi:hypothetical protein [Conexibacter woesei]|uniref:hypothetical protein n=1 Tax=Conexibacter woesei TaxID=191495 RepID=UPI00042239C6|nr:hypothetical protein [Conexibacter woesei]
MSRRLLAVLTACLIVALSASAVAFAHSGGGRHHRDARHGTVHRTVKPAGFLGAGLLGASVNSLAQRLSVDPADLRTAIKQTLADERARQLTAAGLTPQETAALKACRGARFPERTARGGKKGRRGVARTAHHTRAAAGCDATALKSARAKLKAAPKPDYNTIKSDLAAGLAQKLGKTPDDVIAAVRAELDARLTQAVTAGWLTQKGHDLALACFDDPSSCDIRAFKGEFRFPGHHDAGPSDTTPPSTTAPSGTMTPGGRQTSTPLR